MVDRGWIPEDLKDLKIHWTTKEQKEEIYDGVLIYGEGKCSTGK